MTPFIRGFAHELVKMGGALKSVGRFAMKHPIVTLTAAGTAAATGMSAASAYKQGLQGGEKPRYLHASVDPYTGEASTSPAAYTNFNQLVGRKPSRKEVRALSKNYKEKAFNR